MTIDTSTELFEEILLCARYGELPELKQNLENLDSEERLAILQKQDERGNTALHFCSANGHIEVVKYLIEAQRNAINVRNEGGNTALHWAALNGHLETVKVLVEANSDVKLKNKGGRMAIDEAESQNKESIVLWLLALDMQREKAAGVYAGDNDDDESGEQDINVNLTAGAVEPEKKASSSTQATVDAGVPTDKMDEMNMLD